jgi:hypothetical protein
MRGRRLAGLIVAVVGVLAMVGSFVWRSVAVDALVRFPTDLDVTPEYEGTVSLSIDPQTYAALATPRVTPLAVHRHLQALGDESSKDRVVVKETLDLASPGFFTTTQENQYVMGRRSMLNLADPRAWAFTPDNVVDRSGSYRLNFPFDTDETTYQVYKNEVGTSYQAAPGDPPRGEVAGFDTINFTANQAPLPITPAYLAALDKIVALPRQLSLDQLKPILAEAGFDIDNELPQLLPRLAPADVQAIAQLAQQPVGLQYQLAFEGGDAVEPYTGAIADVTEVKETLTAKPSGDSVTALVTLLQKYPNVPAAQRGLAAIGALDAQSIRIFLNEYHQTEASVADIAKEIKDQRDRRTLAERVVPNVMLISGIVLTVIGLLLLVLPSWRRPDAAAGGATPLSVDTPADEGTPVLPADRDTEP